MKSEGKHRLELSEPVFPPLTLTVFHPPPTKSFTRHTEVKVEAEILKNKPLICFPGSAFLFSRVQPLVTPPFHLSPELGTHNHNQSNMMLFPVQYEIWYLVFAEGQYGMRLQGWVRNKMSFHCSRKPSLLVAFSSNNSSLFKTTFSLVENASFITFYYYKE